MTIMAVFKIFLCVGVLMVSDVNCNLNNVAYQKFFGTLLTNLNELASKKGINITEAVKLNIFELSGISPSEMKEVFNQTRIGRLSPGLLELLNTTSIQKLKQYYPGFDVIPGFSNYNISLFMVVSTAVGLDTPTFTQNVIMGFPHLGLTLFVSNITIARLLNTTLDALQQRRYLTDVYPKLRKIVNETVTKNIGLYSHHFKLPPRLFEEIVGKENMKNLKHMGVKIALYHISGKSTSLIQLTPKITSIVMLATKRLSSVLLLRLNETSVKCNISSAEVMNYTLDKISQKCLKVKFPILRYVHSLNPQTSSSKQLVLLTEDVNVKEIFKIIHLSGLSYPEPILKQADFVTLFNYVGFAAKRIQVKAAKPIALLAAERKIKVKNITLLGLAEKVIGVSGRTLAALYNLSSEVQAQARMMTFHDLQSLVHQKFRVKFDVKSFTILTFQNIIDAFLVHQNITEGLKDLLQNYNFIKSNLTLGEIQRIFSFDPKEFPKHSIDFHLLQATGVSIVQLMRQLGVKVHPQKMMIQELLNKVTLDDAKVILSLRQNLYNYTANQIEMRLVERGPILNLFTSPMKLLASMNVSRPMLNTTSLIKLAEYGGVTETNLSYILAEWRTSGQIRNILRRQPVTVLAVAFDRPNESLQNYTIFRFMKDVVKVLFRPGDPRIPPVLHRSLLGLGLTKRFNKTVIMSKSLFQLMKELTVVSWQLHPIIEALGAKTNLIRMLNTSSMKHLQLPVVVNHFPLLLSGNFSVFRLVKILIYLDSPKATRMLLSELGNFQRELLISNTTVASILNVTDEDLLQKPFLTDAYPTLRMKLASEVNKTTIDFITKTLKISPMVYSRLNLMPIPMLAAVRRNLTFSIIDGDMMRARRLRGVINGIYDKELLRFFARTVLQANVTCRIRLQKSMLVQQTLADVMTKCMNVNFSAFAEIARHAGKGPMVLYFPMFNISEVAQVLQVREEILLSHNISAIGAMVLKTITDAKRKASMPIILVAYDENIKVKDLPAYKVFELAAKTLRMPVFALAKLFKIPNLVVMNSQNLTFMQLPIIVKLEVNVAFAVSHFYHLSYVSLLEAFLVHKNATEGEIALEKSLRYMIMMLKLKKIRDIYGYKDADILDMSSIELLEQNANVSSRELAKAINITLVQENLLKNVRYSDALILFNLNVDALFEMTSNDLGDKIIKLGREAYVLFTPIKGLLSRENMTIIVLQKFSFIDFLKASKVPKNETDKLLVSLRVSQSPGLRLLFGKYPIQKFAEPLSLTANQLGDMIFFRTMRRTVAFFKQAINKCDKFKQACNSNATCENTADAVLCKCKSGYVGPEHGLNCIDDNECNIQSKCDRHAVCSNTIGSYACKCKSGYSGSGKLCTDINECEASNAGSICIKNAQCVNQQGSYKCRCKPGFAGNGTYCFDACTSKPCPSDADCQSVPGEGSGHICRCTKSDYSYSSKTSTCEKIAGEKKLFKVTGMKFNQDYRKEFADTNSKPFKEKAAELEGSLNDTVCPRSGCEGIKVTKIGKGSIVVDFIAIFPKNTVVTAAQVQTAAVEALSDPKLADLSPDNTTTPKAQVSNLCDSGGHDCDSNADCIPDSSGISYLCRCKEDYEKQDGKCTKKSNVVAIVVPVVICSIILIGLIVFCSFKYCRNENQMEQNSKQPYAMFRSSSSSADLELKVGNIHEKNISDF